MILLRMGRLFTGGRVSGRRRGLWRLLGFVISMGGIGLWSSSPSIVCFGGIDSKVSIVTCLHRRVMALLSGRPFAKGSFAVSITAEMPLKLLDSPAVRAE